MRKNLAIATSDWHITADRPRNRLPGYQQQQYDKVEFTLDTAVKVGAVLLNAGDLFDRSKEPRRVSNKYTRLLRKYKIPHYACAGQHDQVFQSKDLSDTSIGQLYASGLVTSVRGSTFLSREHETTIDINCRDWGDTDMFTDTGLLVAHFCVTEKPVEFIAYSLTAEQFLAKSKAKITITGDYHKSHIFNSKDGRLLVNPGSIMRNASDTLKRKPCLYLIDLDTAEVVDRILIPILPVDEVFDLKQIERDKKHVQETKIRTVQFDQYVSAMKDGGKIKPDFNKNLDKLITNLDPKELVKAEIAAIMEAK